MCCRAESISAPTCPTRPGPGTAGWTSVLLEGGYFSLRLILTFFRLGDVEHLRGLMPEPGTDLEAGRLYWLTDRLSRN